MTTPSTPAPKKAKKYQTRRTQEIKQREQAREQRASQSKPKKQPTLTAEEREARRQEYEVPIAEPGNSLVFWKESRVRREWPELHLRLGLAAEDCEAFIAARRRPPQQCTKPCVTPKSTGWYLGNQG
jgi:hypothetical protein